MTPASTPEAPGGAARPTGAEAGGSEISDLALLSNCQATALVDASGCVRWLCWPRADAPPLFADLLDPRGGMWRMGPAGPSDSSRRYLTDSLVLQTTFRTPTGRAELTEALVLGSEDSAHDIGKSSPQLLVRHFAVTEGTVTLDGCLMPRGRFGRSLPTWAQQADDLLIDIDGERLLLQAPPPQRVENGQFFWHLKLQAGESATFALGGAPQPGARALARTSLESLAQTLRGWRSWSDLHDTYRGAWRDEVRLSGRVLQGLTFSPTGASIAAPTTSLPRRPDGSLNRDYRLVLLEHAAATAAALKVAACTVEAGRQVAWLVAAATTSLGATEQSLPAVFGLDGAPAGSGGVARELAGWEDQGPVRVADEGWTVCRPDAVGDLLAAVREVKANVSPVSPERRDRLRAALWAGVAAAGDPAERGGAAGSAVLSWLALDAAAGLPHWFGVADADAATAAATVAALQVRDRGWDASTQTFTAFDPAAGVEAASLLLCLSGLVPADDPAMIRTVERVAETLSAPCGLIYRYEAARGLEGPSLVCTYWLVRCLVAQGLLDRAEAIFEQATAYANDVGLLSEQSDPDTGRLLGNFPYGPSHAGLVLAARDLEQGRELSVTAARTSPPR